MKKSLKEQHALPEPGYRPKTEWASVGAGDAFADIPVNHFSLAAQRRFYREIEKAVAAARKCGRPFDPKKHRSIRPQLSPALTNVPASYGAWTSIGMTAYLQFAQAASDLTLFSYIHKYLSDPASYDHVQAAPDAYRELAQCLARIVQARVCFSAAAKYPQLRCIETYRLFMATIQKRRFESVEQAVALAVLYDDLIVTNKSHSANAAAASVLEISRNIAVPIVDEMACCERSELRAKGTRLLKSLCVALSPFLPQVKSSSSDLEKREPAHEKTQFPSFMPSPVISGLQPGKGKGSKGISDVSMEEPELPIRAEEKSLLDAMQPDQPDVLELDDELKALLEATVAQENIETPRSETIVSQLRSRSFADGPLEGAMFKGHEVRIKIGENRAFGELFSRVIRQKSDHQTIAKLTPMVQLVARELRRLCYPSVSENAAINKFKASGRIDGPRLPNGKFSEAIFKRYKRLLTPDPQGEPVLLLCCDGSASLNEKQMTLLKILAGAWILASGFAGVKLLAALYHSDKIRPGLTAPVVKWIYHPDKTFARSRAKAVDHVLSLPKKGTGKQADALSLAYLIDQAKTVAAGKNIYMVLISDCAWNKCFPGEQTGKQEVKSVMEQAALELKDRFHSTLLGLGLDWETGFESIVNEVFLIDHDTTENVESAIWTIARHTAKMVKQREQFSSEFGAQ